MNTKINNFAPVPEKKKKKHYPNAFEGKETKLQAILKQYPFKINIIADRAGINRQRLYNMNTRLGIRDYQSAKTILRVLQELNVPVKSVHDILDVPENN